MGDRVVSFGRSPIIRDVADWRKDDEVFVVKMPFEVRRGWRLNIALAVIRVQRGWRALKRKTPRQPTP